MKHFDLSKTCFGWCQWCWTSAGPRPSYGPLVMWPWVRGQGLIVKVVGKPLGWGPLNNQPHIHLRKSRYLLGISPMTGKCQVAVLLLCFFFFLFFISFFTNWIMCTFTGHKWFIHVKRVGDSSTKSPSDVLYCFVPSKPIFASPINTLVFCQWGVARSWTLRVAQQEGLTGKVPLGGRWRWKTKTSHKSRRRRSFFSNLQHMYY